MQDVLRVLMVALCLLASPRDGPGVPEQGGVCQEDRGASRGRREMERADRKRLHGDSQEMEEGVHGGGTKIKNSMIQPGEETREGFQQEATRDPGGSDTRSRGSAEQQEAVHLLYVWNLFSVISMIRFFWKHARGDPQEGAGSAANLPLPDADSLRRFYSKRLHMLSAEAGEGKAIVGYLLKSMRSICERDGLVTEVDFRTVSDIVVTVSPKKPCRFECRLRGGEEPGPPPGTPVWGQIELVEDRKVPVGCHCQSSAAEDVVCLLHGGDDDGPDAGITVLCDAQDHATNGRLLSKWRVCRWLESAARRAWAQISYRCELEVAVSRADASLALAVRSKSGRKMEFTLRPVVRSNSNLYMSPSPAGCWDHLWALSLPAYENLFFHSISRRLPENACHVQALRIALYLHRRQTALTGSTALKEDHFTAALTHLLLSKAPREWRPDLVSRRLRDLLGFVERGLEKKQLLHGLVGNPRAQSVMELPAELVRAAPLNLLRAFADGGSFYGDALLHLRDMLRNAPLLIRDYDAANSWSSSGKSCEEVLI